MGYSLFPPAGARFGWLTCPTFPPPPSTGPVLPAGLVLDLDSRVGVTLSGSNVTAWADQSGSGNDFSVPAGVDDPTLVASAINGLPALAFTRTATMTSAFTVSGAKTTIIVRQLTSLPSTTDFYTLYNWDAGSASKVSQSLLMNYSGYQPYTFVQDAAGAIGSSNGAANALDTAWHAQQEAWDGSSAYTFDLDGTSEAVVSSAAVGLDPALVTAINSRYTTAGGILFGGNIEYARVLVWPRVLSADDQTQANEYLQSVYAIPMGA